MVCYVLMGLTGTDKVNIMTQDQITNHCFSKQLKVLNTCRLSPLAESLVSLSLCGKNIIGEKYYNRYKQLTTGLVIKQYGGTK